MPNAVVIGRVAVKVLPDTGDFRKDAQRKLDAIEKRIEINIPTTADMTGAERSLLEGIRDLNARNRSQDSRKVKLYTILDLKGIRESLNKAVRRYEELSKTNTVKLKSELVGADLQLNLDDANLKHVKDQIDKWRRDNSPVKVPVKLDLSAASKDLAAARLDFLARPRTVNLIPKVDNKALLAAGTVLAALSGGRALHSAFEDFGNWLRNLDKAVPKIAAVALGITAIGGYALTAAANLAALSASLASIAPLALGLPGLLGGMAIGLTVTIVALKDFKKYVPEVSAAWSKLKTTISENFWSKAQAPIRSMIDNLLPEFVSGFSSASTEIGGYFGGLATALNGALKPALKGMFADLSASVHIATKGTPAIASLVKNLGTVGAHLLPRLAKWFVTITDKFAAFIDKATKDGRLQQWIDNALTALHQLGQVLSNIGGILSGIGKAASAAGGSSLGLMADTLDHVNKVVNSPAFQNGLTRTFASAFQMMHNIAVKAGPPLTALFETLSRTFETVLPTAGKAIGTLIGSIAKLFGGVGVQNALISAFDNINKAVQALSPAIVALEPFLAALIEAIGKFAAMLGPLFAAVIQSLAPVAASILKALEPLASVLTGALTTAVKTLGPTITTLGTIFTNLLTTLTPVIEEITTQLQPVLVALQPVVIALAQAFAGIATAVAPAAAILSGAAAKALIAVLHVVKPLVPTIVALWVAWKAYGAVKAGISVIANWGGQVVKITKLTASWIKYLYLVRGQLIELAARQAAMKWAAFQSGVASAAGAVKNLATAIGTNIKALYNWVVAQAAMLAAWVRNTAATIANTAATLASKAVQLAIAAATKAWAAAQWLLNAALEANPLVLIATLIAALVAGIILAYQHSETFRTVVQGCWQAIRTAASYAWNKVLKPIFDAIVTVLKGVVAWWKLEFNIAKAIVTTVFNAVKTIINGAMNAVKATISTVTGAIRSAWSTVWNGIKGTVSSIWNGIKSVISGAINAVKSTLGSVGSSIKTAWDTLWNGMSKTVSDIASGLADIVSGIWDGVTSGLKSMMNGAIGLINGAIHGINHMIDVANKIPFVNIPHVGEIPSLAKGATILPQDGGTLAILAEAGKSETVVDTGKVNALIDQALKQNKGSSNEQPVQKVLNYYAAPGASLSSEEDLFAAAGRARLAW